jgi:hypothetical protein
MVFQIRNELNQGHVVNWVVFDSKTGMASLTVGQFTIENICEICNYPDFAKAWNIPINGCKVYFEGKLYYPCYEPPHYSNISYYDCILTTLKLK